MVGWTLMALLLSAGAPAEEDLSALMSKAQQVQRADVKAWRDYRFRRAALREERNDSGQVLKGENLVFEIRPAAQGFEERLLEIEGRKPTPDEAAEHARKQSFTKHYATLVSGKGSGEEEGFSLGDLLRLSNYRYAGRETIGGRLCHRVDFSPDEDRKAEGVAGKLAKAMAGRLWLTVDGLHLARAEARTVRAVSLALSLAKVHQLEVVMEAAPISEGVWLPQRIDVDSKARVFFSTRYRTLRFRYSEFLEVKEPGS